MRQAGPTIAQQEQEIVEEFYANQVATPEIDRLIGDSESLGRLKHHLGRYLRTLFSGIYDDIYVLSRLRVGMVHNRIGVPPKLYVSSMRTLLDILRSRLTGSRMEGQCGLCSNLSASLERFLLFDLSLVFDTYIHSLLGEVERSKQELEQYAQSLEAEVARRTTQLAELALNDPLTGLPNRRAMFEGLRREMAHAVRSSVPLSLLCLDLDGFKAVNDTLGHEEGDRVLLLVAQAMRKTLRAEDLPVRMGGDEFAAVLPGASLDTAREVAQRLFQTFDALPGTHRITMSVGIATLSLDAPQDPELLLRQADASSYKAKKIPGHAVVAESAVPES